MQSKLKILFTRIWRAPENVQWMSPFPIFHRRGIILAGLMIVIGLLLPKENNLTITTQNTTHTISFDQSIEDNHLVSSNLPSTDHSSSNISPNQNTSNTINHDGIEQHWRIYQIAAGQTLAQLFRDNHLPPTDVYAMTEVEGKNKPLSNLQSGQMVHIRINANGIVTGLVIKNEQDSEIKFIRQTNGKFRLASTQ